jgi:hypothetical protein
MPANIETVGACGCGIADGFGVEVCQRTRVGCRKVFVAFAAIAL